MNYRNNVPNPHHIRCCTEFIQVHFFMNECTEAADEENLIILRVPWKQNQLQHSSLIRFHDTN